LTEKIVGENATRRGKNEKRYKNVITYLKKNEKVSKDLEEVNQKIKPLYSLEGHLKKKLIDL